MFKLKRYLRKYKKESVIAPMFKMLEACFELLTPLVMARIVDVGIRDRDMGYIMMMCAVMVAFGVFGLLCSATAQYFAAKAATGFGTALREDLFRHVNSFSYTELDMIGTSTLVTRLTSDINQVQAGVNLLLRLFLRSPFIVVGAVVMAFVVNARLAWIFVVLVPVLSLVIYGIMLATIPLYKKVQNRLDVVLRLTRESLAGARVVRAFSRQEDEIQDFREESEGLMHMQLLVGKISALLNPATYVIINAAILVVLWLGGGTVYSGELTQGGLIALINYMTQVLLALLALSMLIVSVTKASASAGRINDVFSQASGMKEGGSETDIREGEMKVSFRHVDFAYKGGKNALTDIRMEVKRGQTIGIIGGTGSGKSTVVNLIPRFYDASAGEVLVDGVDVREYPFSRLRGNIGIVPQNAVLFAGTIRENMQWGKKGASDDEIYRALEIAQAKEFVEAKPDGLETMVLQGGKNFSGGQRQRLTIARALVGEPEILILDDSASALDFATDAKLRRAIAAQTRGMTVFIVSQRAASIKDADQILVLDDGRQVGLGTHRELLETCGVYHEICMSQFSEKELEKS
ncbi:ABC transporter ATP-binding protein [Hominisplanchenecus murintestinalis]|uniref:ABC transporter ATP-binding protein n=1 Tax=Hominisplanchenecus murintestinalis TaxID=2941517 RepID=A0AC61QZQ4_9FIRM|nr:ABC transporter ATP-binding protein [Hominisplanchenecus murintestinalis]NBH98287.1 ABC transporter ATP-binding protein [Lachnospiraceae bacterium]NBI75348.1 ABC transporter ATP-binding protein [Lachnospiraceae bacterium]RKK00977.1 ABC transporter ATP-binding protein [Anaerotruncus sp. 1XD22-93]TGX98653.1 ABC transporter ATP-binding protein [Hominisplanchenecus murintestinalis]